MIKGTIKKLKNWGLTSILMMGLFSFGNTYAANNYSDVMRKANAGNPNFGNSCVYDIAMLASHDAMSDKINNNSEADYSGDVPESIGNSKLSVVRSIATNYARTQSVGLTEQLNVGSRYIDARITYKKGVFYSTHGFVSGKLEGYLKELVTFLLDNPGEFVVFNIAYYDTAEGNDQTQLAEYMQNITVNRDGKDYSIYDFINYDTSRDFSSITYDNVTKNGTKGGLVIISRCINDSQINKPSLSKFFKRKGNYAAWYNKSDPKKLLSMVDDEVEKYKNKKAFRCNCFQTTQDATSIGLNLTGSLIDNAKSENVNVVNHSHFSYWLSCMPIACFDEVISTKGDFNTKVNDKILNYNLNLNKDFEKPKYNRLTSESQLKDGMKIVIKEVNGTNGYAGDKFKTVQVGRYLCSNFLINDNPSVMWTLKKTDNGWKIKLPNGKWLDRNFLGYLVSTKKEKDGVPFKFDFTNSGTAKVHYDKYYMYANGSKTLDLSKSESNLFEIYG